MRGTWIAHSRQGQARLRAARGQALLEYVLLFGLVAAAVVGMQVYGKRALQATLKMAADDMSPFPNDGEKAQVEGMKQESGEALVPGSGGSQGRVTGGSTIARTSSSTTTEQSRITAGAAQGGGAFLDYGAGATTTTQGTSSTTVVSEMP